jgi:CRISPR/Cas system-associated protein Cas10 (large subunit of type III CRISPR-Cas system)
MLDIMSCRKPVVERIVELQMARKSKSPRPKSFARTSEAQLSALQARADDYKSRTREASLSELVERRRALEELLIEITNAADGIVLFSTDKISSGDRQTLRGLRRVEDDVAQLLQKIERRFVKKPAKNLSEAILKLTIYGKLQGYDFTTAGNVGQDKPLDESLFFSALEDLKRMVPIQVFPRERPPGNIQSD